MKRPTVASLKKVTPENLTGLGVDRLAAILASVADARPDIKRRLRMELAAAQGSDHLAVEIDRRLGFLETSRSKVSWRQRPTFVRDLDVLRLLIADRLAKLDSAAALARLWLFMDLARRLGLRMRDKDGELAAVFVRAVGDIGALLREANDDRLAEALVDAVVKAPAPWADWLPLVLEQAPPTMAEAALQAISRKAGAQPGWVAIIRQLADAADNVDAFASTFAPQALRLPSNAAQVAQRLLIAQRVDEAGRLLEASRPATCGAKGRAATDFDWETVWIDYLELSGQPDAAQDARWSSFERTVSAERARAFTQRLPDFDDVEAEGRAFEHAARHHDVQRGLQFLMEWPAVPEAARMIAARADELDLPVDLAELWANRLRVRQPVAAHTLLRMAAATALRRRESATCDRLTLEADAILAD